MAHTVTRQPVSERREVEPGGPTSQRGGEVGRRSEFVLAMAIFVTLSIIGTAFGLWMVGVFNAHPTDAPPAVTGQAPAGQEPPPASARPDGARPADAAAAPASQ
jgi:hypothetical protein